ncbi:uncharacterized protein METZ01_LOCUS471946, partial [marine metagenome]
MFNKFFLQSLLILLISICAARNNFSESWVDYDGVSKISLGTSQKDVVSILGEPLMLLADIDDSDNTIYLYYNY